MEEFRRFLVEEVEEECEVESCDFFLLLFFIFSFLEHSQPRLFSLISSLSIWFSSLLLLLPRHFVSDSTISVSLTA